MSGFKKMLLGEKMPDKDDPQYKTRYKKEVQAGQRFAQFLRIDKAAVSIQCFANRHRRWFLGLVFGFLGFCLALNVYRMITVVGYRAEGATATQYQEQLLKSRHDKIVKKVTSKEQNNNQQYEGIITED